MSDPLSPRLLEADKNVRRFVSNLVTHTKYASHLPELQRRQSWEEATDEVMQMHVRKHPDFAPEIRKAFGHVYRRKVLASMRSMQFGGFPIEIMPNRIFNCAYAPVRDTYIFAEFMFLLLGGTGVGFSVREHHVAQLPAVQEPTGTRRWLVQDSIEGWCDSLKSLTKAYFRGQALPIFDYRDVRPEGSLIKKTGGRAPGSKKLRECHEKIALVLHGAIGRKLEDIEVYDIVCFIAQCILAGGIREAALIALFSPDSTAMLTSKSIFEVQDVRIVAQEEKSTTIEYRMVPGQAMNTRVYGKEEGALLTATIDTNFGDWDVIQALEHGKLPWYYVHAQRGRSNNSAVLRRGIATREQFERLWDFAKASNAGEPGILWMNDDECGFNPCVEAMLEPFQFCNLTTAVVYDVESQQDLNERVKAASLIGTLQASYTDFHYLRPCWKEATERGALLGVSMTGMASGKVFNFDLTEAAIAAKDENERVARILGINPADRVTCIKPEGSGTLAAGVMGHGIHAMHGSTGFFVRSNRIKKSDPTYAFLMEIMPDFLEDEFQNPERAVIAMPLRCPEGSIMGTESALDFLARIRKVTQEWVVPGHRHGPNFHNVSATVSVREEEWEDMRRWMWENKNEYNGLSVLPYFGGNYKQAPFREVTREEWEEMVLRFPENVDFTKCIEEVSVVDLQGELACAGGACIV